MVNLQFRYCHYLSVGITQLLTMSLVGTAISFGFSQNTVSGGKRVTELRREVSGC